jgi:hypothetical protein
MLVEYERQAFQSRFREYARVSFDRRIRCQVKTTFDFTGIPETWQSIDVSHAMGEQDSRIVLELKFTSNPPLWLGELVRRFRLTRRGYSKYCSAVSRTLHRAEESRDLELLIPAQASMNGGKQWRIL